MATILITGGHKGIGLEASTRICAAGGYDLVLAGRTLAEMEPVAEILRARYHVNVRTLMLDVSSLGSVSAGAATFQAWVHDQTVAPLSVLVLNAGAQFMGPVEYSVDGVEKTFATNCLGHFLLLKLLLPDIQPGGRVIFTASGTHDPETMDGKMVGKPMDPHPVHLASQGRNEKPASAGIRYTTSKLCVVLYAYALDRRLRAAGSTIQSIAFDPGLVVDTNLARTAPPFLQWFARTAAAKWMAKTLGVTMGSLSVSGAGLAQVAIDPAYALASGKYIQSNAGRIIEARSSIASYDAVLARKVWDASESLIGIV